MSEKEARVVMHSVMHLQATPSNDAERVSQLLMGERVTVLKEESGWAWVQGEDTYRGWAELRWLAPCADEPLECVTTVFAEIRRYPDPAAPLVMRLPLRARVHINRTGQGTLVRTPGGWAEGWLTSGRVGSFGLVAPNDIGGFVATFGREFVGTPYLWGGSSSFGLDCSGFVQYCYRAAGVTLRRDADIQREDPRFVPVGRGDLLPGDLVFFGRPDRITHVGMHLEGNTFIHSAGGAGVILTEWGDDRYSPSYVDARRLNPMLAGEPVSRFEAENR